MRNAPAPSSTLLLAGTACAALAALAALVGPAPAARAAGYYVGEIGARSIARGGANIVSPRDPSAAWLNPAALTLSSGVQIQLDFNLVNLASSFVRDCGGLENGCAPLSDVERSYGTGRDFAVVGGSRRVSAEGNPTGPAEPRQLGNQGRPSFFDGNTAVTNQAGLQPIPRLFVTFNTDSLGWDGFALGAYVYAPSAGDYAFDAEGPTRYTLIDRDMLEVYYGLAAAYRYGDWFGVGGSFQLVSAGVKQSVRLTGDRGGNEDLDHDITVNIDALQHLIPSGNFGIWANPLKALGIASLELGASVQLPRTVRASGPLSLQFGDSFRRDFIDSGLAVVNQEGAVGNAEFVLPPFYRVGLKYGQDDVFGDGLKTLGFDVEAAFVYEAWSTYDHVFLAVDNLTFSTAGGAPEPLPPLVQPKDWQDAWSVRLGGTVALWDRMVELHGGGFYETSAIPNSTYSVELVCGDKVGFGTGISATFHGVRLDLAYSRIMVFDRVVGDESIVFAGNVENPLNNGETRTRVAMGRYQASYDMVNVGLTVAFDSLFGFGVHAPGAAASTAPALPEPDAAAPVAPDAAEADAPGAAGSDGNDGNDGSAAPAGASPDTLLRMARVLWR